MSPVTRKSTQPSNAGKLNDAPQGNPVSRTVLRERRSHAPEALVHSFGRRPVRPRPLYARCTISGGGDIAPTGRSIFGRMLDLIDVRGALAGSMAARAIARHAAGDRRQPSVRHRRRHRRAVDGRAAGAAVPGHDQRELLKIDEMEPYSLPIDFPETKEALKNNMAVRHEALRLLKQGVTIVVFPGRRRRHRAEGLRQGARTCRGRCFRPASCRRPRRRSFRCIFPARTAGCSISSAGR